MKFQKQLEAAIKAADPEWDACWINYKMLKKRVKELIDFPETVPEEVLRIKESEFTKLVMQELRKCKKFFVNLNAHFLQRKNWIEERLHQYQSSLVKEHMCPRLRLMNACLNLKQDLELFKNYSIMTFCGFSKILKKHDKRSKYKIRDQFMKKFVETQEFATYPSITNMIQEIESIFDAARGHELETMQRKPQELKEEQQLVIDTIKRLNEEALKIHEEESQPSGNCTESEEELAIEDFLDGQAAEGGFGQEEEPETFPYQTKEAKEVLIPGERITQLKIALKNSRLALQELGKNLKEDSKQVHFVNDLKNMYCFAENCLWHVVQKEKQHPIAKDLQKQQGDSLKLMITQSGNDSAEGNTSISSCASPNQKDLVIQTGTASDKTPCQISLENQYIETFGKVISTTMNQCNIPNEDPNMATIKHLKEVFQAVLIDQGRRSIEALLGPIHTLQSAVGFVALYDRTEAQIVQYGRCFLMDGKVVLTASDLATNPKAHKGSAKDEDSLFLVATFQNNQVLPEWKFVAEKRTSLPHCGWSIPSDGETDLNTTVLELVGLVEAKDRRYVPRYFSSSKLKKEDPYQQHLNGLKALAFGNPHFLRPGDTVYLMAYSNQLQDLSFFQSPFCVSRGEVKKANWCANRPLIECIEVQIHSGLGINGGLLVDSSQKVVGLLSKGRKGECSQMACFMPIEVMQEPGSLIIGSIHQEKRPASDTNFGTDEEDLFPLYSQEKNKHKKLRLMQSKVMK